MRTRDDMNIFEKLDKVLDAPDWAKENNNHALIYASILDGAKSNFQLEGHGHTRAILKIIRENGYHRDEASEPGFTKGSLTHWKRNNTRIEFILSNFLGPFTQIAIIDR